MIFGRAARKPALIVALFFPTLIIMTGEILTEATATLVCAIFLYLLVRFWDEAVVGAAHAVWPLRSGWGRSCISIWRFSDLWC